MPPDLPVNVAERPDNSQLDSEPQPSNLNTKECSLKHLPNEVLIVIAQNCQDKDLGTLCQVSKLMQSIAGRELYRTVVISTNARRIRFCRTITEEPASGRYFVEELKFLPPADVFKCPNYFMETLKRLSNLRRLTIALVGRTLSPTLPSSSIWELQLGIFHQTWDIFTRSQGYIFAPAILPRLEQVRLIPDIRSQNPNERLAHPRVLNPFLRLPSLSHLEFLNDSGIWIRDACLMRQGMQPTMFDERHYQQIKSVILRESDCCPTAIMHILKIFCDIEVFFLQNRQGKSWYSYKMAADSIMLYRKANQSEKYYLPDFLEISPNLKSLALVPIGNNNWTENVMRDFLGPYGFLNLTKLRRLESLSALITLFASPDGETTGLLTVSPVAVLPASLKTLHIIVDHESLMGKTPLDEAWFQPREAALQFLEELASFCAGAFPSLREVEYIWAVDRTTEHPELGIMNLPDGPTLEDPESIGQTWDCDGSVPLCCDMHTTIQALSPYEDYTSKAEGIFSPFIQRFNNLHAAFKDVNVAFHTVEMDRYSDYFFYWRGDRK